MSFSTLKLPVASIARASSTAMASGTFCTTSLRRRAAATALQAMTQSQFDAWAAMVVVAQGDRPTLLLNVLSGQNDKGDTATSVGGRSERLWQRAGLL